MGSKVIELKTWPEYFEDLNRGKTFEIRKDDREFKVRDFIILKEWVPEREIYTGRKEVYVINYILGNKPEIGLKAGYCILAITKVEVNNA